MTARLIYPLRRRAGRRLRSLMSSVEPTLMRVSLGRGGGATEEPLDRDEPFVADVDAVLVDVERDVLRADLVRHLLREGADVVAARLRIRERVLDGSAD